MTAGRKANHPQIRSVLYNEGNHSYRGAATFLIPRFTARITCHPKNTDSPRVPALLAQAGPEAKRGRGEDNGPRATGHAVTRRVASHAGPFFQDGSLSDSSVTPHRAHVWSSHLYWVAIDCEHGLASLFPGSAGWFVQAIEGTRCEGSDRARMGPYYECQSPDQASAGRRCASRDRANSAPHSSPGLWTHTLCCTLMWEIREGVGFYQPVGVVGPAARETIEGADNVEEIAPVPEIAQAEVFLCPSDLSTSLGYAPLSPNTHPDVETVVQCTETVAPAARKKVALFILEYILLPKLPSEDGNDEIPSTA
ncbi:hypothetical protein BJY52DRAFT_1226009 [Lactarius psammicola]|nr:hypothetical protein BJY52DRAFT_1226009 [Lactarius psammicola]